MAQTIEHDQSDRHHNKRSTEDKLVGLIQHARGKKKRNREEDLLMSEGFCLRFDVKSGYWKAFIEAWKIDKQRNGLEDRGRNKWLMKFIKPYIESRTDSIKAEANEDKETSETIPDCLRELVIGPYDHPIDRKKQKTFLLRMTPSQNTAITELADEKGTTKNTFLLHILMPKFEEIIGKAIIPLTDTEIEAFESETKSQQLKKVTSSEPHGLIAASPNTIEQQEGTHQYSSDEELYAQLERIKKENEALQKKLDLKNAIKKLLAEQEEIKAQLGS